MERQTRLYLIAALMIIVAFVVVVVRTPLLSGQPWIPWGQWLPGTRPFKGYPMEVQYVVQLVLLASFAVVIVLYYRRTKRST